MLLDYGADVNVRDSNNQRPVELAPPGGKTQQLLQTFEGIAILSAVVILNVGGCTTGSFFKQLKETTLSFCSFSEESLPVVSYPDQEPDWSIQTEAAPCPSSPFPAHQLSGAHVGSWAHMQHASEFRCHCFNILNLDVPSSLLNQF